MSKNSILPNIFGSPVKFPLEKNKTQAYCFPKSVAKNNGQNWSSELSKMRSRILSGFFYACDKICCVMTDCVEESIKKLSLGGSGFRTLAVFLDNGKTNSVQSVTLQLVLKLTVSQKSKETTYV